MRFFAFIFGAVATLLPVAMLAAAPGSVTGLQVEFRDDETVAVSWDKLKKQDIAYYRVYYSSESILRNQGSYDDFEQTDGPKGLYVFNDLTPDTDFYVSVLAVNTEGEESEFFAEEAFMHIPAGLPSIIPEPADAPVLQIPTEGEPEPEPVDEPEPIDEPLPDEAPSGAQAGEPVAPGPFQLMAVAPVSSTEISVEFSQAITKEGLEAAAPAFTVNKPDGTELEILSNSIDGIGVMLKTVEQEDIVYELVVSEMLMSAMDATIDPDNRSVLFVGASATVEAPEVPTEPEPTEPEPETDVVEDTLGIDLSDFAEDVVGLNMRATRTPNGLYDVVTVWDLASLPDNLSHYVVGQSLDRGKTFIGPSIVPNDITELRTPGIESGNFGVMIKIADEDGNVSPGIFVTIDLSTLKVETWSPELASLVGEPDEKPVPPVVDEGPKVEIEERPDELPSSGTAFVLMTLMFSGAIAGRKVASKKK